MRIWVLSSFFSKTIFGCGNLSPAANRISAGIRRCRRLDLDRRFIGFSHIYLCLFIQMVSISFIWFYSIRFRMGFLLSSFESSAGGAVSWRVGGLQFIVAIPIKFNCCNAIVSAHQCPPVRTHTHEANHIIEPAASPSLSPVPHYHLFYLFFENFFVSLVCWRSLCIAHCPFRYFNYVTCSAYAKFKIEKDQREGRREDKKSKTKFCWMIDSGDGGPQVDREKKTLPNVGDGSIIRFVSINQRIDNE